MSDNVDSASGTPDGPKVQSPNDGDLPYYSEGNSSPSLFSARDRNNEIAYLRALKKLIVKIADAEPNFDGTYTATGKFIFSGQNSLLQLFLPPANGDNGPIPANAVPMQVVAWTTTNDYFTANTGAWTAPGTFTPSGDPAVNVALPWDIRQAQNPSTGTGSEVWTPYTAGDIVYVIPVDDGGGVASCTYLDLNCSARAWALRISYSNATCVSVHRFVVCSPEYSGA